MIDFIGHSFEDYLDEKKLNKIFEPFLNKRLRDEGPLREEKIINQLETKAARESNKLRERLEAIENLLQINNESFKNFEEKLSSTSKLKESQIKDLRDKIKSIENHISLDLDISFDELRSQIKAFKQTSSNEYEKISLRIDNFEKSLLDLKEKFSSFENRNILDEFEKISSLKKKQKDPSSPSRKR